MQDLSSIDLSKFDVISFDVYDTLIKRDVYKPSRIFHYIEDIIGKDFSMKRIRAEHIARENSSSEEVTIEDIYNEIQEDNDWKDKALKYELSYEEKICRPNLEIVSFLNKCKKAGKKVVIISDMYLPEAVVSNILVRNNISYDSLYVSSKNGNTKRTGSLYKYVKSVERLEYKKWLHVGDNKKSDYLSARKLGISVYLVNSTYNKNILFNRDNTDDDKDISSFISNRICSRNYNNDYFYSIGYESLGPLLIGFSKWLKEQFDNDKITKVFFLSRDGQLMQAAFNACNYTKPDHQYMYASRRALIVPSIFLAPDLDSIINNIFWPRYGTIKSFLKKIGLDYSQYMDLLSNYNLEMNKIYEYNFLFCLESFVRFYNSIKEDVIDNSKREYNLLVKYLNDICFSDNVAVVDIGWHGNMQKALSKIVTHANINAKIIGYYIGINPEVVHDETMKGYIFDSGLNEFCFYQERLFTSIFEMIFTANHGSVKRFIDDKKIVEFEPFEYRENISDYNKIVCIQKAALDFISDYMNDAIFDYKISEVYGFEKLVSIGIRPTKKDALSFGSMVVLRDEISYIAAPRKIRFYLFHPKKFIKDLKTSSWRIGFLKRLTGLTLPYYQLYYSLKSLKKNK